MKCFIFKLVHFCNLTPFHLCIIRKQAMASPSPSRNQTDLLQKANPLYDVSLSEHMRATLKFGLPLVGAQLASIAIGVTDTVMIGWLGATELAAAVLATQFYFLLWIVGAGISFAVIPLASSALGADNTRGVRRSVRMGLWLLTLFSAAAMIPLWFAGDILLKLGQDPEIAALAGVYMHVALWAFFPALLVVGLRAFLISLEYASFILWATISGTLLNALLNYIFIFGNFGAPRLGISGAALATVGTNVFVLAVMVGYILLKQRTRTFEIFTRIWRPDWEAFVEILRLGWPISAALLAETGLFAAATVMMGWLGTIPLAAHGIAMQVVAMAFMIPLGLANAATVRIGVAFGRRDRVALGRAGLAALIITTCLSLTIAVVYIIFPGVLIARFLDMGNAKSVEVLQYAIPLLIIASVFHLFDGLQVVGLGLLRGLKDTRVPMYIAVVSYWMVGVPIAYLLAFTFNLGGTGIWTGMAVGLVVAAGALLYRFARREQLSLLP